MDRIVYHLVHKKIADFSADDFSLDDFSLDDFSADEIRHLTRTHTADAGAFETGFTGGQEPRSATW